MECTLVIILFNHKKSSSRRDICHPKNYAWLGKYRTRTGDLFVFGQHQCSSRLGSCERLRSMQWLMLQQEQAKDYVIATGKQYSVKDFITWAANSLGVDITFSGSGVDEIGVVAGITGDMAPKMAVGQEIVKIDPRYFRPTELKRYLETRLKQN